MPSALVRALHERRGLPLIDASTIDVFLEPAAGESKHALLLFAGDAKQRAESDDVAVVLPELLKAFGGRLRGGVVALAAEGELKARFHVVVAPSLVVTRGQETVAVIPKIRDWSEYVERIGAALAPDAPAMKAGAGPKTEFSVAGARV
jgi:hydrogenase-1 operon protein HyaE